MFFDIKCTQTTPTAKMPGCSSTDTGSNDMSFTHIPNLCVVNQLCRACIGCNADVVGDDDNADDDDDDYSYDDDDDRYCENCGQQRIPLKIKLKEIV